jgi:2,3-bisphosphoglycerate-independent phosphoglycerate mutase
MDWHLKRHPHHAAVPGPVLVVVMDGVGVGPDNEGNAVRRAHSPVLHRLATAAPFRTLKAHGRSVGLPSDDDMGNSEVGHNALGGGRIYNQGAKLVNEAIATGALFRGPVWTALIERTRRGGALHFLGLLSDGNVHSHQNHLYAMIREADRAGVDRLYVHALLDGRDVPETSALDYVAALEKELDTYRAKGRTYRVASGGGRMKVTMDRYEAEWGMVALGWKTHVCGEGERFFSLEAAVRGLRAQNPGVIDQDLPAFVIGDGLGPWGRSATATRWCSSTSAAIGPSRSAGALKTRWCRTSIGATPRRLFAGMMQYDGDYQIPKRYLVEPPAIEGTLGRIPGGENGRHPVRLLRDAEIRARHLLLEREPQRQVR